MDDKGKPWQNPYAESVVGHLKDEVVWLEEYTHFQQHTNRCLIFWICSLRSPTPSAYGFIIMSVLISVLNAIPL